MSETVLLAEKEKLVAKDYIGKSVKPRKDLALLQGKSTFTDDIKLPNMVYAYFVRSPYAHARIKRIDYRKALELPGVVYVLTGKEEARPLVYWMDKEGMRKPERYSLAKEKVRYVGEPVAVVAAETRAIAEDACELIEVEYEPLPAVVDAEKALEEGSALLYEEWGDNILYREVFKTGAEEKMKEADLVIRERLVSNRYSPTPIETRAVVSYYDAERNELTVWASTQFPHVYRTFLSHVLSFPENRIRVIAPSVGGGFGIKSAIFPDEVSVVILSMKLGRPVKWVEDRKEHIMIAGHERQQVHYVECAVKKDGTLLAVKDKIIADFGAYGTFWTEVQPAMLTAASMPGPYRLKHYDFELNCVVTNKAPCGPHRGFGRPVAAFVMERMMDIIARKLGIPPEEVRLRNMINKEELPWTTPIGVVYDTGDYKEVLRRTLKLANYENLRLQKELMRKEGKYLGIGLATYVEYTAPSSSRLQGPLGWHVSGWESCRLIVDPNGKVTAYLGTASSGQAHETIFAQITADALGARLEDVVVKEGDTEYSPYGFGNWASRSTVVSGGACIKAAKKIKEKMFRIASHMLNVPSEDLDAKESVIYSRSDQNKKVSFKQVADLAIRFSASLPEGLEPGLDVVVFYEPEAPTTCSYATHLALVEVDIETGHVKLLKYFVVDDSGIVVNPLTLAGQLHGALAHGIGGAMFEELLYDSDGQLLSSTFVDYLIPTATVMPEVIHDYIETPSLTLGGFKGMGEGGAIPTAAAIANAVEDALSEFGVTVRELPLKPESIYRLIKSR